MVLLVHLWISLEHPHLPPAGTDGGGGNDDDEEEEGGDEEGTDDPLHVVVEAVCLVPAVAPVRGAHLSF